MLGSLANLDRDEPAHAASDAAPRRTVLRGLGFTGVGYPLNVAFMFFAQVLAARSYALVKQKAGLRLDSPEAILSGGDSGPLVQFDGSSELK